MAYTHTGPTFPIGSFVHGTIKPCIIEEVKQHSMEKHNAKSKQNVNSSLNKFPFNTHYVTRSTKTHTELKMKL